MTETSDWHPSAAAIFVQVDRDLHLADCDLARAGGADATLACAECGRAHKTRHDTCGQFCWVTERTLTAQQIGLLGTAPGLPDAIRAACARALNDYGLGQGIVREARRACALVINTAKRARP